MIEGDPGPHVSLADLFRRTVTVFRAKDGERMTQRYAQHYPESLRDGVDALEAGR